MVTDDLDFEYDGINEAILLQDEDGISYSPNSADPPSPKSPDLVDLVLLDSDAGLASKSKIPSPQAQLSTKTPPQQVELAELAASNNEGGPGYYNGAEASGMARTARFPPPPNQAGKYARKVGRTRQESMQE